MRRNCDRIASAVIVIGMQVAFLVLLMQSARVLVTPQGLVREMTLSLPRLRSAEQPASPAGAAAAPRPTVPALPSILSPPDAPSASPNVQGLGKFLFGCAPENYATLTQDDRARCPKPGEGLASNAPPDLLRPRTHVKNEARWATDLARKQSAPWLPCTITMHSYGLPPTRALNFHCLTPLFADGSITNPRTWQIYDTQEISAADRRDLQVAYDAWRREQVSAGSPPPPSAGTAPPGR